MTTETLNAVDELDVDKLDQEIEHELMANISLAFQTDVLKKLISKVEGSVSKKSTIEVYTYIYLEFREHKIVARAINSDYTIEAFVLQNADGSNFKITGGKPCSICFPADKIVPIVKRLDGEKTSITIERNVATIKSGRPKFNLNGVDGTEFPTIPEIGQSEASIEINPSILSTMYDRTIYAASTKEHRPVLTGVHHRLEDNRLLLVSTDSHRLAQYSHELDGDYVDTNKVVPVSVLNAAKKHLDSTEEDVTIHFCKSQVIYSFETATLYSRTIEGNFPPTDKLIFSSEQAGASFSINAGAFKALLNNSTVYNDDQPIVIRVKTEEGCLRVNTQEAQVGAFQEDLVVTNGSGEDVAVAVNVRYLQNGLKRYNDDDTVQLQFMPTTAKKAIGLQPFKLQLLNGHPECLELFVPVRTEQIKYAEPVVIEDFQGVPEFDFNPFEGDFINID